MTGKLRYRIRGWAGVADDIAGPAHRVRQVETNRIISVGELELREGELVPHVAGVRGLRERRSQAVVVECCPPLPSIRVHQNELEAAPDLVPIPEAIAAQPDGSHLKSAGELHRVPSHELFSPIVVVCRKSWRLSSDGGIEHARREPAQCEGEDGGAIHDWLPVWGCEFRMALKVRSVVWGGEVGRQSVKRKQ